MFPVLFSERKGRLVVASCVWGAGFQEMIRWGLNKPVSALAMINKG